MFQGKPFIPLIVFANCSHISRNSLTNQLLINRNARGNELALSILHNRDKGFSSLKEILSHLPVRNIRRRLARTTARISAGTLFELAELVTCHVQLHSNDLERGNK